MVTTLKSVVNINITRDTAKVTRKGFGTALILGENFVFPERVRTYSDPTDMINDGFLTTDKQYIAALSLMSQTLSSEQFKIGRKFADVNAKQKFSFSATPDTGTFTITLGVATTSAIAFGATLSVIETAIEALAGVTAVTATGGIDSTNGLTIEFVGVDANTAFETMTANSSLLIGATPVSITPAVLQNGSALESWADAINNVITADADWYALVATARAKADINSLADIIETKEKIYGTSTADADVLTSAVTDIASDLKGKSLDRTFYLYSADTLKYPEAAWLGGQLPKNPGSTTWKFKTLKLITPDNLTATQITNLTSKNANYYEALAGINIITSEGIVASNEYIDIIRGIDWLTARMTEKIFAVLANSEKVPFTVQGQGVVETAIRAQLELAADPAVGLIVKASISVTLPDIDTIPSAEKTIRFFDNIQFGADLQGAVHKIRINGKLSV